MPGGIRGVCLGDETTQTHTPILDELGCFYCSILLWGAKEVFC